MSKYSRTYDYSHSYGAGSRSQDLDTPSSSSSRYGLSSGSYRLGSSRPYDGDTSSRYSTRTRNYDTSSGNHDNNTRNYDYSTGTSDTSSRLSSYPSRYDQHGDPESTETKTKSSSSRTVRPAHQRYRLVDEDPYIAKSSSDVKSDDLRSRRYRSSEKESEPSGEKLKSTQGRELYRDKKRSENQESFELERPVFSSVEDSVDLKPYSFRSRDRYSDSRVTSESKDRTSENVSRRDKLRNYSDNTDMSEKQRSDRKYENTSTVESSRRHWRKSSEDENVKTNGVHPKQSNVSVDGKELALTVDSTDVAMDTKGLSGWRRRRLEREQREKAKAESEASEKHSQSVDKSASVRHIESKPSLGDEKTHGRTQKRHIEKIERPKSVDADTIKNILLTSDSPLLRSRYREAVRKREELQTSSEKSSASENVISEIPKQSDSQLKSHVEEKMQDKKSSDKKIEKSVDDNSLKFSPVQDSVSVRSRTDKSSVFSNKEGENNIAKDVRRNEKKDDQQPETKRRILVSRSRVDNLRDSVRRNDEQESKKIESKVSATKDDDKGSDTLKTSLSKKTDLLKEKESERALYSRRLLSSSSSKDEKQNEKPTTDQSVSEKKSENEQKSATLSEKLSKRAAHARRAKHHRQEGPSLVKHMSDLLFEDPKSVRSERLSQSETKSDAIMEGSKMEYAEKHSEMPDVMSKDNLGEKSQVSASTKTSRLHGIDIERHKQSAKEIVDKEMPAHVSKEKVSIEPKVSVPLTQFSARKTDKEPDKYSSRGKKLNTAYTEPQEKKTDKIEVKSSESVKSEKMTEKLYQPYSRAKTTDVASLLKKDSDETESQSKETTKKVSDDLASLGTTTMANLNENTQLSRAERIAKYKEERKRQLAYISNKFGNLGQEGSAKDVVPSLFHAAREENKEGGDSLSRSRSLREESPQKFLSPVLRSKSLREDLSPKKKVDSASSNVDSDTVTSGKKTSVMSIDESGKEMPLTEKIAHTRKLFEQKSEDDDKESTESKQIHRKSLTDTTGQEQNASWRRKSSSDENSLEKMKHRYLFGTDFSESKARKSPGSDLKEEKIEKAEKLASKSSSETGNNLHEINQEKADEIYQKRRRQLPSIPMVLGEISPTEGTESKSPNYESNRKNTDSKLTQELSRPQDLSSVSSTTSSLSSDQHISSSKSSASSSVSDQHHVQSDKSAPQVQGAKQEFLSPTAMKPQLETTSPLPPSKDSESTQWKSKTLTKHRDFEENRSQSTSGCQVNTKSSVDSKSKSHVMDTNDILEKFKELETMPFETVDTSKPQDGPDIPDSEILSSKNNESYQGLESNKITKPLSKEIQSDKDNDKSDVSKISDDQISNSKSTKIRRRSPVRSRIPVSPVRKIADQEKESPVGENSKSIKDKHERDVSKDSNVSSSEETTVKQQKTDSSKISETSKTEKNVEINMNIGKETKVEDGPKISTHSNQKEKFVSEVKKIEVTKRSAAQKKDELPVKGEGKSKIGEEQRKPVTGKEITSLEVKTSKESKIASKDAFEQKQKRKEQKHSNFDKNEPNKNISNTLSQKGNVTTESKTSDRTEYIPFTEKDKNDLRKEDTRAPQREITKSSTTSSDARKDSIVSTTSIEIKPIEKSSEDLKNMETVNTSKLLSSENVSKKEGENVSKTELLITDSKSSDLNVSKSIKGDVSKPTQESNSQSAVSKVESKTTLEVDTSAKQKTYSSDESGKSGKLTSKTRHLKSTSGKSSKSGGLKRSKTITEKELKSPLVLKKGPKEGTSAVRSKEDIRSILSKSPEANLDDLLLQNVEYLSDIETKEPWAVKREPSKKASDDEQTKVKRFHRKKNMQRRKSESDSGTLESKERLSADEMPKSKEGETTLATEKKHFSSTETATIHGETENRFTTDTNRDFLPVLQDNKVVTSVGERAHAVLDLEDSARKPAPIVESVQSHSAVREKTDDSIAVSMTGNLSINKISDAGYKEEVTLPDKSQYISDQELLRMKAIDKATDSDSTTVSEEGSGRSPRSESDRKRRKDKTSVRKSSLNIATGETTDVGRRGLTAEDRHRIGARSPSLSSSSSLNKDDSIDNASTKRNIIEADEVSSAISKFSGEGKTDKNDSLNSKKEDDSRSPRRIPRRNNFSSLLQKFSGSEQSSSENEQTSFQQKTGLRRQEAYTLTSSEESETRRTPERTQSLRVKKSPSPDLTTNGKGVQRSESFKSDFMKRRYSPEPENRVPLTEDQEMAQPNPELAAILNRRQKVVTDQQIAGAEKERERITSKNVEKEEFRPSAAEVEEVIADSEVASVLKARRKETDLTSKVDTQKSELNGDSKLKADVKILHTEPTKSHSLKSDFTAASESSHKKTSSSSSLHEHDIISKKSHDIIRKKSHDKDAESTRLPPSDTKLGMSAIDTSLEILSTVAKDSESPKQSDLEMSLTKVKVESDEDVAKFITDVQKSKLEQKESISSDHLAKPDVMTSDINRKSDKTVRKSPERVMRSKMSPSREDIVSKEKSSHVETVKSSTTLRRAESYRTKEVEKPKGILKRTASMKKSGVIVDPELAGILQQRRQQQGDEEEEDSSVTLSAKKDIAETIGPEPEERREKELNKAVISDEEDTTHMSIQERIYHMKTRLDESKSCPITPKSISGATTPKFSYKGRTGSVSSGYHEIDDSSQPHSHVSGEQLIEKLSDLADKSHESVTDKRKKFQHRSRDDWRTRTQPVTLEEIHEADSLDSVISFRREVLKKASKNVFENIQKQTKTPVTSAKSEFPQPFRGHKVRRSRSERHKTLPITAAELSAIPEGESAGMATLRNKSELLGKRDSKADSGILSGSSDVEGYYDHLEKESYTTGDSLRSLSLEMDINQDDPATLSVSAKASMFTKLEEKSKNDKPKSSASGAKRYIDRKKRERSRTQPVTEDEVKTAAEIADGPENQTEGTEEVTESSEKQPVTTKPDEDAKETDDDLSRRSLAEKVKLFSSLKEQEKQQQKAEPPPVIKRRNRKLASRFNTQPITIEEVEKAAQYRVSPLAMSLVKPPDPEMLKGLSVNAQREIMAQHAEVVMSQPGSRSSSRHSSTIDLSQDNKQDTDLGTSKKKEEISKEKRDVQSMLKSEKNKGLEKEMKETKSSQDSTEPKSALKMHDVDTHEELKRIMLGKTSEKDTENKTTLKTKESADSIVSKEVESDVSVLKEIESVKNVHKGSSSDEDSKSELRGILKKEGSFEVKKLEAKEGENGDDPKILKKDFINEQEKIKKEEVLKMERIKEIKSETAKKEKSPSPDRTVASGGCSSAIRRRGRDPKQPERYLTQPTDSTPEKSPETTRKMKYGQARHKTQPVTPEEKREAEGSPEGVSIKNRLQALQKSGEEDWRKRISKQLDFDGQTDVSVKLREKKRNLDLQRPSSIADRLNLLESSQGGWRERIEEHDAKRFTVAHKLAGQVEESPLVKKIRERTKKDSESESGSDITSPSTPTREWAKIPLPKTIISGTPIVDESKPEPEKVKVPEKEEEKDKPPVKVSVPTMDDEELKFFFMSKKEIVEVTSEKVDVTLDDMDEIFMNANDILQSTRKIRPKRKHTARSKNPLKTMSMTVEVKTEYEEVSSDVAERELRRLQTAKIARDAGFAQAALAGLASKENFAKVELRKTADAGSGKTLKRLDPYQDVMLLHVKGRRRTQVRLVEPCAKSINSGDCYLLVTPDKIINWVGEFSNVIEKAKAADVASFICQKRDMGCKAGNVETVEEKRQHLGAGKKFWSVLGGLGTISSAGPPEEDELYENHIVETNMVYRLQNNSLTPYQEYWGLQPKYEMLKKDEVLVFDFGSELYVWQGKAVKPDQRKMGVKLARQLWEKAEEFGGPPVKSNERPSWALFGKVNQNMETILFREKFSDWPDTSRLIKVKSTEEIAGSRSDLSELKPYDASLMIPVNTKPVSLILEGSHVGRGVNWLEDMEGFIREQNIVTLGVKVWHVLEYDHYEVPDSSYGQFHDGDTYVVRWQYMITNKGTKDLKGTQSKRTNVGRERCAYFFWQGKSSTINEKGASALMTVELDEERGPQVRVDEGKEMPCFLNLFGGRMIIHIGKREEESTNTQGSWRCYCVRSDYENELCLLEVPKGASQLRSHSSLLMLNINSGLLYIWHGCRSPPHTRKLAKLAAERLKEKCPLEVGMKEDTYILISEMDENSEKEEFWSFLDIRANDRSPYHSLLTDSSTYNHTLRLFHLSSVSGVFEVQEILNPSRTPDVISPFPFLQSDLYKASQPALFLVDNCNIIYLWHGWWPEGDAEIENIQTGSAKARFCVDRKCAIDTAMHYCNLKNPENPPKAVAVHAGLEPLEFTNLFPFWDIDETARSLNLKDGKREGEITLLEEILEKVTQTRYTYEELLEDPLPEGVDPLRLESYLHDDEFDEIMEMSRDEFYALPGWKQGKIKQQVGLF